MSPRSRAAARGRLRPGLARWTAVWSQRIGPDQPGVPLGRSRRSCAPPRGRAMSGRPTHPEERWRTTHQDPAQRGGDPHALGEPDARPARRARAAAAAGRHPAGPDDLTPIFPMGLIAQEVSAEPEVEIPDEVREIYKLWRPTPLYRRTASSASSIRPPTSTTSTRAPRRPGRTSRTPPCRRPTTTARRACAGSRPRPAPASGAPRSRSPAG